MPTDARPLHYAFLPPEPTHHPPVTGWSACPICSKLLTPIAKRCTLSPQSFFIRARSISNVSQFSFTCLFSLLFFLLGILPCLLRPCEWVRVGQCCLRATGAVWGAVATPRNCPTLCRCDRAACWLRSARTGHKATAHTAPTHHIDPTQPTPSYGLACLLATGRAQGGCCRSALPPCALSCSPCCLRTYLLKVAFFALPPTTPGRGSKNADAASLYLTE